MTTAEIITQKDIVWVQNVAKYLAVFFQDNCLAAFVLDLQQGSSQMTEAEQEPLYRRRLASP